MSEVTPHAVFSGFAQELYLTCHGGDSQCFGGQGCGLDEDFSAGDRALEKVLVVVSIFGAKSVGVGTPRDL